MTALHAAPPCLRTSPLTADDLPPGYHCVPLAPAHEEHARTGVRGRSSWRWLPADQPPTAEPLAVDVTVTAFEQRTGALKALTAPPVLPAELAVRPLFAPRIGEETAALRADVTEDGTHYVLYRVDVQAGRAVASVAATWRWPAGSPNWVYERARRMAARLAETH